MTEQSNNFFMGQSPNSRWRLLLFFGLCGEVGWLHSPLTPFLPAASPALPTRSSSGSQRKEEAGEADEEQGAGDASVSGAVPARHTA